MLSYRTYGRVSVKGMYMWMRLRLSISKNILEMNEAELSETLRISLKLGSQTIP